MFANENSSMNIYNKIIADKKSNKKSFSLLIDPDKQDKKQLLAIIEKAKNVIDAEAYNKFFKEQKIIIKNNTKELEIYKELKKIEGKKDTKNCKIMSPKKKK